MKIAKIIAYILCAAPALVGNGVCGSDDVCSYVGTGLRRKGLSCGRRRDVTRCNSRCCGLVRAGVANEGMV
ncbi:MAG: hypothetical protein ACLSHF_14195 [[Eubacterium] siraeum]